MNRKILHLCIEIRCKREIAEKIGEVLQSRRSEVDVLPMMAALILVIMTRLSLEEQFIS